MVVGLAFRARIDLKKWLHSPRKQRSDETWRARSTRFPKREVNVPKEQKENGMESWKKPKRRLVGWKGWRGGMQAIRASSECKRKERRKKIE